MSVDSTFWKEVMLAWAALAEDPVSAEDIPRVPLWNSYFVKNKNILKLKNILSEHDCMYINDLMKED